MTVIDFNDAKRQGFERQSIDVDDVRARLRVQAHAFVQWLFSGRAWIHRNGMEARIGDVTGRAGASLKITLTGPEAGLWHDFATGEGGDLIDLYAAYINRDAKRHFGAVIREIAQEFLGDSIEAGRAPWEASARARIDERAREFGTKPRADTEELGPAEMSWHYKDTSGRLLGIVRRYRLESGDKTFRMFNAEGQAKAPHPRPLYRLPEISLQSHVVLVEGEKCADALASIGIEATTAMGGAHAPIDKTDWTPLSGKLVTIWPDNDDAGRSYAGRVAPVLAGLGCRVALVRIPDAASAKWDAADCIAGHGDAHDFINRAQPFEADAAPQRSKLRILDFLELVDMPPPIWLVETVITESGLSVLWGRSGSLKSFVALDMAMSIAAGRAWHGMACQPGLVLYIAAEGAYGLAKRALGWYESKRQLDRDLTVPKLKLIPHALALTTQEIQNLLIEAIQQLPEQPVLIVIDTLARTFGAADENSTADMNAYVSAVDRLRETINAHVMLVHHAGKDESKGERGNSALRAAADTVIHVSRKTLNSVHLINVPPDGKQKDAEEFETIKLRTTRIEYEHNGQTNHTLVLVADDGGPVNEAEQAQRLGPLQEKVLDMLREAARADQALGFTEMQIRLQIDRGSLGRALRTLTDRKLATEFTDEHGIRKWRFGHEADI